MLFNHLLTDDRFLTDLEELLPPPRWALLLLFLMLLPPRNVLRKVDFFLLSMRESFLFTSVIDGFIE